MGLPLEERLGFFTLGCFPFLCFKLFRPRLNSAPVYFQMMHSYPASLTSVYTSMPRLVGPRFESLPDAWHRRAGIWVCQGHEAHPGMVKERPGDFLNCVLRRRLDSYLGRSNALSDVPQRLPVGRASVPRFFSQHSQPSQFADHWDTCAATRNAPIPR